MNRKRFLRGLFIVAVAAIGVVAQSLGSASQPTNPKAIDVGGEHYPAVPDLAAHGESYVEFGPNNGDVRGEYSNITTEDASRKNSSYTVDSKPSITNFSQEDFEKIDTALSQACRNHYYRCSFPAFQYFDDDFLAIRVSDSRDINGYMHVLLRRDNDQWRVISSTEALSPTRGTRAKSNLMLCGRPNSTMRTIAVDQNARDFWCNAVASGNPRRSTYVAPEDVTNTCSPSPTPNYFGLGTGYGQYCNVAGVPIIGLQNVEEQNLTNAGAVLQEITRSNPRIAQALTDYGQRIILLKDQQSMPQDLEALGIDEVFSAYSAPLVLVNHADLGRCADNDEFRVEGGFRFSILIHEIAHAVQATYGPVTHDVTGEIVDIHALVQELYHEQRQGDPNGIFEDRIYASSNSSEYWAMLTNGYFWDYLPFLVGVNNFSLSSRRNIKDNFPREYKLLQQIYGDASLDTAFYDCND